MAASGRLSARRAAGAAVLAAAAVVLAPRVGRDREPARAAPIRRALDLGVFHTPARRGDALPRAFHRLPLTQQFAPGSTGSRRVGTAHGFAFWIVPGRDGMVCIAGTRGQGAATENYGSCTKVGALQHYVIYTGKAFDRGRVAGLAVITPNGFTTLEVAGRTVPIHRNVAFVDAPAGRDSMMRLRGPGGARRDAPLRLAMG